MPTPDANRAHSPSEPVLGPDHAAVDDVDAKTLDAIDQWGLAIRHAVPLDQPDQVHQLTEPLYRSYEIEGGTVSLAGCLLEDVPFVQIVYAGAQIIDDAANTGAATGESESADEVYLDITGRQLSADQARQLGLYDPQSVDAAPPSINRKELDQWLISFLTRHGFAPNDTARKIDRCTLIWCKKASGKIMLSIKGRQATIPFSGWSRDLLLRKQKPPPFECPATGRTSYRVTLTDAGQLTVPDAIKTCAKSGRRVLETELRQCTATGRLVLPEFLQPCQATGDPVIRENLRICSACGQQVSPQAIREGTCATCQSLKPVDADDPFVHQLLADHCGLKKLKSWMLAESPVSRIVHGSNWRGAVRIRCDRQTGEVLHVGRLSRLARNWKQVDSAQWAGGLG